MSRAHHLSHEPVATLGDTEPGALDHLEHPAEVQARIDCALPWWWAEAAAAIFVATVAISALFPWGFA